MKRAYVLLEGNTLSGIVLSQGGSIPIRTEYASLLPDQKIPVQDGLYRARADLYRGRQALRLVVAIDAATEIKRIERLMEGKTYTASTSSPGITEYAKGARAAEGRQRNIKNENLTAIRWLRELD